MRRWGQAEVSLGSVEKRLQGLHAMLEATGQRGAAVATTNILGLLDQVGQELARQAQRDDAA